MILVDSCVIMDYLAGNSTRAAVQLDKILSEGMAAISPITVSELFSDPKASHDVAAFISALVAAPFKEGYWQRSGELRARVRKLGLKAALGDALIAQTAIDHGWPLLTSDADFKHYLRAGLKLAMPLSA